MKAEDENPPLFLCLKLSGWMCVDKLLAAYLLTFFYLWYLTDKRCFCVYNSLEIKKKIYNTIVFILSVWEKA